jgi:prolyl-tRNA editing enzyme YbaK/EbsC (Cys-tRNA(Pro) deacylase)
MTTGTGEPDRGTSVLRVLAALQAAGHDDTITSFPAGTRSAADAAASVGCDVAQIAKTIVFKAGAQAALIVTSGAARVDMDKAAKALGTTLSRADAAFVRDQTGFAIGGVSPVAQTSPCLIVLDESLRAQDPIWAAAGSPNHVFQTTADWLARLTGAQFADVAA